MRKERTKRESEIFLAFKSFSRKEMERKEGIPHPFQATKTVSPKLDGMREKGK